MVYANINKQFYCGVDLHARTTTLAVKDREGKKLLHTEIPTSGERFLKAVTPYKHNLAVACESTFNWYWLHDLCENEGITFCLGHAYYIKAITCNKIKDDHIDSNTLCDLVRTQMFPVAYAYPEGMREARDLLRRRATFVQQRAALGRHMKTLLYQQGYTKVPDKNARLVDFTEIMEEFELPEDVIVSMQTDLNMMKNYDKAVSSLEARALKQAKSHDAHSLMLLQTIQGMGDVLSLTILYEMHNRERFKTVQRFSSYARVVKPHRASAGKKLGTSNAKIGNPYLCWAFHQLVVCALRYYPEVKKLYNKLKRRRGPKRAMAYMAHQFAVAVYYMLKNQEQFDVKRFVS